LPVQADFGRAQALLAWLGTRTVRAALTSKNQRRNGKQKKQGAFHTPRDEKLRRKGLRYGIRKRWVLFLLLFEGVANRAAETSSLHRPLPLWQQVLGERAAKPTAEGIPSARASKLKNTAGHFLLMIPAGSTCAGAVLPRTVQLKAG
jgi:hypothetical protein